MNKSKNEMEPFVLESDLQLASFYPTLTHTDWL